MAGGKGSDSVNALTVELVENSIEWGDFVRQNRAWDYQFGKLLRGAVRVKMGEVELLVTPQEVNDSLLAAPQRLADLCDLERGRYSVSIGSYVTPALVGRAVDHDKIILSAINTECEIHCSKSELREASIAFARQLLGIVRANRQVDPLTLAQLEHDYWPLIHQRRRGVVRGPLDSGFRLKVRFNPDGPTDDLGEESWSWMGVISGHFQFFECEGAEPIECYPCSTLLVEYAYQFWTVANDIRAGKSHTSISDMCCFDSIIFVCTGDYVELWHRASCDPQRVPVDEFLRELSAAYDTIKARILAALPDAPSRAHYATVLPV